MTNWKILFPFSLENKLKALNYLVFFFLFFFLKQITWSWPTRCSKLNSGPFPSQKKGIKFLSSPVKHYYDLSQHHHICMFSVDIERLVRIAMDYVTCIGNMVKFLKMCYNQNLLEHNHIIRFMSIYHISLSHSLTLSGLTSLSGCVCVAAG